MSRPPRRALEQLRQHAPAPWRLAAVAGFVAAGTLFVTSAVDSGGLDLRASSVSSLDGVVRQERSRADDLQRQVEQLGAEVDRLGADVGDADVRRLRAEVEAVRGPAGFSAVRGPGVTVTLTDAPDDVRAAVRNDPDGPVSPEDLVVHQQDLQAVANALWAGGAEAMTLQDQRVISTTGIKCIGNTVILHGVPYAPPYVITAIGDPTELLQALDDSPYVRNYRTYVPTYQLGYDVRTETEASAPAYTGNAELRYARAVPVESSGRR